MIRTDQREWRIEDTDDWKNFLKSLTPKQLSIYNTFRSYRGHIVRTDKKIERLEEEIETLKDKRREYLKQLTKVNSEIDHLRKDFYITINVSFWKKNQQDKNEYFMGTIQRSGYKKIPFNLGNVEKVKQRLMELYKGNSYQLNRIRKVGDDREGFRNLVNGYLFNLKDVVRERIKKEPQMKSLKKSLDVFFPLVQKVVLKPKGKGVSIPLMITNQMRMDLSILGYTKDEMKHLTPKECWEIINKGEPKKPSRERGRNQ